MRLQGVCKTGGPIATSPPTSTKGTGLDDYIAAIIAEAPPLTAGQVRRIAALTAPELGVRVTPAVDSD